MSVFVKRYNCKDTIASACVSENWYVAIKLFLASFLSELFRINAITSSKIDTTRIKASTICKRASALRRLKRVRRMMTSCWKVI